MKRNIITTTILILLVASAFDIFLRPSVHAQTTYNVYFSSSGLTPVYSWSVTLNGQTESSSSPGNNVYTITFSEPNGAYPYTVTPPSGFTASPSTGSVTVNGADQTVQINFNSAPSPTPLSASASAAPTSGYAPLSVQFTGSASGGSPPYSYSWSFGDGYSSNQQNPSHTYQSALGYTATLTVTDSVDNTAAKSITITLYSPAAYTVTITSSSGGSVSYSSSYGSGTVSSGQSTSLQVPSGTQISLTANPDSQHAFGGWSTSGSVYVPTGTSASTTLTVNGNGEATAHFVPNQSNLGVSISPSSATIQLGNSVQFSASASGGSGTYSHYVWYWMEYGTANQGSYTSGSSNTYAFTPSETGSYGVYVVVTDSSGNTAQSLSSSVTVQSTPPPSTSNLQVLVYDEQTGNPIQGARVRMISAPSGQSLLSDITDSSGQHTFQNVQTGSYSVQVTASGYSSGTGSATVQSGQTAGVTILLGRASPPQAAFTYTPLQVYGGMTVTFDASSSSAGDPNATITQYEWTISDPNNPVHTIRSSPTIAHEFSTSGTYVVQLNVTNSVGLWSTTSKPVVVARTPNPYDLNGDGHVDIQDIAIATSAFGTVPGDSRWNPIADIIGPGGIPDGEVAILDIAWIAKHFGDPASASATGQSAAPQPQFAPSYLSIDGGYVIGPSPVIGQTFNVTVSLNNGTEAVQHLIAIEYRLQYNNTLIQPVAVTEGPFFKQFADLENAAGYPPAGYPPGTWITSYVNDPDGVWGPNVLVGQMIFPNAMGLWNEPLPNGTGVIVTITFQVTAQSSGTESITTPLTLAGEYAIGLDSMASQNLGFGSLGPSVNGNVTIRGANIKKYLVTFVRDAEGRVLINPSEIERGATVYFYFRVEAWDGASTYIPVNDVPVTVSTPFYTETFLSKQFNGWDGVVQAGPYDTSGYSATELSVHVVNGVYNGVPVEWNDLEPLFPIKPRTSTSGVGFDLSASAALDIGGEGTLQNAFLIKNDGTSALDVITSRDIKMGIKLPMPIDLPGFAITVPGLSGASGINLDGDVGLIGGGDCHYSDPSDSTQASLVRYLVTLEALDYAEASIAGNTDPKFVAAYAAISGLRSTIAGKISELGVTSYYSPLHAGAWFDTTLAVGDGKLQCTVPLLMIDGNPVTFTVDANSLDSAFNPPVGGSVSVHLSEELRLYKDYIGIYVSDNLEGFISFDLGFASFIPILQSLAKGVKAGVSYELIYDRSTYDLNSVVFELSIEGTKDLLQNFVYGGLLKTAETGIIGLAPNRTYKMTATFEVPVASTGPLHDDLKTKGLLKLSSILQQFSTLPLLTTVVDDSIKKGLPVEYRITIEQKDTVDFQFAISITLPAMPPVIPVAIDFSFSFDFSYLQTQSFLAGTGAITFSDGGFGFWSASSYSQPPQDFSVQDFILNNFLDLKSLIGSLGTVVQMQEAQSKLYLHVYDSKGNHVGFNFQQNITDMEIPGCAYYDNLNGTTDIVLPSDLASFVVVVDGTHAHETCEVFNLTVCRFGPVNSTVSCLVDQAIESGTTLKFFVTILQNDTIVVQVHDVAVTNVAADAKWVYQGRAAIINVTVSNNGDFPENVTVTLYYNITASEMVGAQNVTLLSRENVTLLFVWNTAGVLPCYTNYTLTAVATITADYTPANNTLSSGNIMVRILGDLNGDGKVDITDVAIAAQAFGSNPSRPRWNPEKDMNDDGRVDITDIALIAKHFRQHYP